MGVSVSILVMSCGDRTIYKDFMKYDDYVCRQYRATISFYQYNSITRHSTMTGTSCEHSSWPGLTSIAPTLDTIGSSVDVRRLLGSHVSCVPKINNLPT